MDYFIYASLNIMLYSAYYFFGPRTVCLQFSQNKDYSVSEMLKRFPSRGINRNIVFAFAITSSLISPLINSIKNIDIIVIIISVLLVISHDIFLALSISRSE